MGSFLDVAGTLHNVLAGFHSVPVNSYLVVYWKIKDFRPSLEDHLIFLHIILHFNKQVRSQGLD